jgi:hypothetical protein
VGSLLTLADVSTAPVVAAGSAVVGVALKDGSYPTAGLSPGDLVMVVQTAGAGATLAAPSTGSASGITVSPMVSGTVGANGSAGSSGSTIEGGSLGTGVLVASATVFSVEAPGPNSGGGTTLLVSVQVPDAVAAEVSTAAAAGQVSLVLLPRDVSTGSGSGSGSGPGPGSGSATGPASGGSSS